MDQLSLTEAVSYLSAHHGKRITRNTLRYAVDRGYLTPINREPLRFATSDLDRYIAWRQRHRYQRTQPQQKQFTITISGTMTVSARTITAAQKKAHIANIQRTFPQLTVEIIPITAENT